MNEDSRLYWNETADEYQDVTRISTDDYHYGPLLPGEKTMQLIPDLKGKRVLELGSGAAQNSIYLAKKGAHCVAVDISDEQLKHAEKICKSEGVEVELVRASLDELPLKDLGQFDFIHSTWAFPFSNAPKQLIQNCADMLKPGGGFMVTTGHPVFAGEWIVLDEHEEGMFVTDYFNPPADVRMAMHDDSFVCAKQVPIGEFIDHVLDAGMVFKRLIEPKPIDLPALSEKEIEQATPYDSESWREMYDQICKVPFVAIYIAEKPQA